MSDCINISEFVDINGYEGLYKINKEGFVLSLERIVNIGDNTRIVEQKILKCILDKNGYKIVNLHKNNKSTKKCIHALVAIAFIRNYDVRYESVDHINIDKLDNNLNNLRIVSRRCNVINRKIKSIHGTGVIKNKNRFRARIEINGTRVHLGSFEYSEDAAKIYLETKAKIDDIEKITNNYYFTTEKINGVYIVSLIPC